MSHMVSHLSLFSCICFLITNRNGGGWHFIVLIIHQQILSRLWHPINPSPVCLIASTHLPPVLLYVAMFPDYPYSLCIATDRWAPCLIRLSIQLLNVFPFTIPVTYCSRPVILINTIHLRESATNITELTHHTARTVLVVSLPDPPSIAPYILL